MPSMGFPAHAGMDPYQPPDERPRSRFPRPRGDGPTTGIRGVHVTPVSPPTRGWTAASADGRHPRGGFPAHAGMDRRIALP